MYVFIITNVFISKHSNVIAGSATQLFYIYIYYILYILVIFTYVGKYSTAVK